MNRCTSQDPLREASFGCFDEVGSGHTLHWANAGAGKSFWVDSPEVALGMILKARAEIADLCRQLARATRKEDRQSLGCSIKVEVEIITELAKRLAPPPPVREAPTYTGRPIRPTPPE